MNKILDFIKNCFSRFKTFLKAKFTMFKKWFKRNQEKIPKLVYKLVSFLIILFIVFSVGTCVGSSYKDIDTAYADEIYYDGDYVTIDIGNANIITTDNAGVEYNIMPSIRSLYLGLNSSINNSFDFYYPYLYYRDVSNHIYDYQYVSISFQRSLSDGTNAIYRYLLNSFNDLPNIYYYYNMNNVNNALLEFEDIAIKEIQLDLYNNSNLLNLSNTFSIRSYVYINSSDYLVNYYAFYDNNETLLGILYFKTDYDRTDIFSLGSNLYTCYNIPIFNFKSINDSAYQDGYDNGYDIGYNDGLNVGGDTSYQQGYDDGYRDGHIDGEQAGYDEGYGQGYFDGSEGPLKIFETIRIGFSRLLKIEIFPNFSIGSIFLLMLSISLLFFVVRVFIK